jgi:ADP-ribose pyrophosphatase YjhB (NUDIX family)
MGRPAPGERQDRPALRRQCVRPRTVPGADRHRRRDGGAPHARPSVEVEAIWARDTGYVTPRVGVGAAIFDGDGRILLQQRTDSGLWALPVGFCEVGETPAAGIAREVHEEMGLIVRPDRLIGVYDCRGGPWLLHHLYDLVVWCSIQGGTLTPTEEAPVAAHFTQADLRELLRHHVQAIEDAFAAQRGGSPAAIFDRLPDTPRRSWL